MPLVFHFLSLGFIANWHQTEQSFLAFQPVKLPFWNRLIACWRETLAQLSLNPAPLGKRSVHSSQSCQART